jgi:hypothetical protein
VNGTNFEDGSGVAYLNRRWVVAGFNPNILYATTPPPCFLKGSKILTDKGYVPVENIRAGDKVKTVNDGFVPVHAIGVRIVENLCLEQRAKEQLYVCSQKSYPELTEDLVVTGCHSILVKEFESPEQRVETKKVLGDNYVTDGHYRLPACVDGRAEAQRGGLLGHVVDHAVGDQDGAADPLLRHVGQPR